MSPSTARTLLLAPPSIAAHEEHLINVLSKYDRTVTDIQMLDRLSSGVTALPQSTYEVILILKNADGTRIESTQLLNRIIFERIFDSMKPGGRLQAQDTALGQDKESAEFKEAILAGLILIDGELIKPNYANSDAVPINSLRRDKNVSSSVDELGISRGIIRSTKSCNEPNGFGNSFNHNEKLAPSYKSDDDDDELIDEDALLTKEEMMRPLNIPAECAPRAGKRRRACKDCTCGLAEKFAAEDAARRTEADNQLRVLKLGTQDLSEIDFTVRGKVGSCGNCSLGDAFRCTGCPYIGMPAFKPGDEIRLLNNDVQL